MFLVMGILWEKARRAQRQRHLLAQGKKVRALVRSREKASSWANQGVELMDGDWNDSAAIGQALKGVEGAFVMLPAVWAPCAPITRKPRSVIANYVEALAKAGASPRVVALSSMGSQQNQRGRDDHGAVASGARFSQPGIPNRICARRRIFRKLPLRPAGRSRRNAAGLLQPDKPEIDHGRDERHRRGGRKSFDRASVVRAARRRAWFDGQRG